MVPTYGGFFSFIKDKTSGDITDAYIGRSKLPETRDYKTFVNWSYISDSKLQVDKVSLFKAKIKE